VKKNRIEKLNAVVLLVVVISITMILVGTKKDDYIPEVAEQIATTAPEVIQKFDLIGDGFHLLYEELAMPNTLHLVNLPVISGNEDADAHIRTVAEARGYKQRRVAHLEDELVAVSETEVIQNRALEDFLAMSRAAEAEGIELRVRSGYRGIDGQKDIFTFRMAELGITTSLISSGSQDTALNELLRTTAPPGYSRHHTGYTVDLESDTAPFKTSSGFSWIAKDNYKNALKYGFIPSYPDGAFEQGPDPEAWEFVWVGTSLIEAQVE